MKASDIIKSANPKMKSMLSSVYRNNKDGKGISKVLEAMKAVDRKLFVKSENPYVDAPIHIGYGQTISQPTTVARMLCLLDLKKNMKVLEVGSGSGWNASLIAYIVKPGKVVSIERIKELSQMASKNYALLETSQKNLEFIFGDALDKKGKIWKDRYDRIIATAGASLQLVEELVEMGRILLKEKGLLLFPTEEGNIEIYLKMKKNIKKIYSESGYAFVPLVRGVA